jgi:2-(1,2-epoxy-1,2-dihydrophenyl)acetyl-CoA isomerase
VNAYGARMPEPVLYDVAGPVATITLNRPAALNALDAELQRQLLATLRAVRSDPSVRALVLTGAGRAFCAGQDLREHEAVVTAGPAADAITGPLHPIVRALADLPIPVIASLNGVAAGAGASLALACDFRVMADTASLLMAYARIALGPGGGVSWTLQRLVGSARAAALMMLAEPITAEHALEMGLVNAVVPADDLHRTTTALAIRLASGPTMAYAAIKSTLAYAATHSFADSLDHEATEQAPTITSRDHRAAVEAFVAKREVSFEGR